MRFKLVLLLCLCSILGYPASGQFTIRDLSKEEEATPTALVVPYAFYTETFDFAYGLGGILSGIWQEQMSLYGTVFHSKNDSTRFWLGGSFIQIPWNERTFLSPELMFTDYSQVRAYISGNPEFPGEQAGSNNSNPHNFVTGNAEDISVRLPFRFVLPLGNGKTQIVEELTTRNGFPVADRTQKYRWNPLESGRTYLEVEAFFRDQRIALDSGKRSLRSNGIKVTLEHDQTDFMINPSQGSKQRLSIARDAGLFKSDNSWTRWEFEFQKFISLGENDFARQQVLAFSTWISDTPTWNKTLADDGTILIKNRPPYYDETSLGGIKRLRAYPENRFSDRAGVHYALEYRVTPHWNPVSRISVLGDPAIDWWQWVGFVEAGRVADTFSLSELHRDMKTDVGFGLRAYRQGILGRLDFAFASESWAIRAMLGQAF